MAFENWGYGKQYTNDERGRREYKIDERNRGRYARQFREGYGYRKHSGATMSRYTPKDGPNKGSEQTIVNGWKLANKQLISISCVTTKKSEPTDKGWAGHIACEVVNKATGQKSFYWGTMEIKTGKTVIKDLGLVLNPRARNGGYCGTFINR